MAAEKGGGGGHFSLPLRWRWNFPQGADTDVWLECWCAPTLANILIAFHSGTTGLRRKTDTHTHTHTRVYMHSNKAWSQGNSRDDHYECISVLKNAPKADWCLGAKHCSNDSDWTLACLLKKAASGPRRQAGIESKHSVHAGEKVGLRVFRHAAPQWGGNRWTWRRERCSDRSKASWAPSDGHQVA